jgi:hypothetical protein
LYVLGLIFVAGTEVAAGVLGYGTFLHAVLLGVLFLGSAEFVARVLGPGPYVPPRRANYQKIEPAGSLFVPDPRLGYKFAPGEYRVTISHDYIFNITHLADGRRATGPKGALPGRPTGTSIWILGASIVHGWSVNDDETFPWLVRERLEGQGASVDVVNFAVGGYGDLQSWIQLQEALAGGARRPALVVHCYSALHDERNICSRSWGKNVDNRLRFKIPYARMNGDGIAVFQSVLDYKGLPLMKWSAVLNFIDDVVNGWQKRRLDARGATKIIIRKMSELCRENGIEFVLAGITIHPLTGETLAYFRQTNLRCVDISVDPGTPGNTNHPYDPHPSKVAHAEYARKLCEFLVASHLV